MYEGSATIQKSQIKFLVIFSQFSQKASENDTLLLVTQLMLQLRKSRNIGSGCVWKYSVCYYDYCYYYPVGAILGTTKPQKIIVHEVEAYGCKWKID